GAPARRVEEIAGYGLAGAVVEGQGAVLFATERTPSEAEATVPDVASRFLLVAGLQPRGAYAPHPPSRLAPGAPPRRPGGTRQHLRRPLRAVEPEGGPPACRPTGKGRVMTGKRRTTILLAGALVSLAAARPPMPTITKPVMFDTPEADAILAALQVFPPDNPW